MSEEADDSSKTFEPSGKKLAEAWENGNFPKAPELGVAFVLLAGYCALAFGMKENVKLLFEVSAYVFANLGALPVTEESVCGMVTEGMAGVAAMLAPMLLGCSVAAVLAGGAQTAFRLSPKVFEPKIEKFNPVTNFKNIFSKQGMVQFLVDLLKFGAVAVILWGAIKQILSDPIFFTPVDIVRVGEFIYNSLLVVLVRLILAISFIGMIHFLYQRWRHHKDLMMTHEEVKQEQKNQDVPQHVKTAQRQAARRLMQKQSLNAVPTADVVVTNPTHYAVALKYERGKDTAPVIVAKGQNLFALKIKEVAKQHGVPTVENKIVARMLYKLGKVGRSIPVELFEVVAQILAHVYRTHRYYFHRLEARRRDAAALAAKTAPKKGLRAKKVA